MTAARTGCGTYANASVSVYSVNCKGPAPSLYKLDIKHIRKLAALFCGQFCLHLLLVGYSKRAPGKRRTTMNAVPTRAGNGECTLRSASREDRDNEPAVGIHKKKLPTRLAAP